MSLSTAALIEKNKVSTDSAWLVLLEIQIPNNTVYIVNNNENIVWNNITWLAFPFQIGDTSINDKETPNIAIKVSNITREIGAVVAENNGGGGISVILRVVNSELLDEEPVVEEIFEVAKTDVNTQWVTFTISIPRDLSRRFPTKVVMQNFCSYISAPGSGYCGIECGLPESIKSIPGFSTCDGTLANCRARGNSARFGGETGLDRNIYR